MSDTITGSVWSRNSSTISTRARAAVLGLTAAEVALEVSYSKS